jgi:hypothetical protein
VPQPHPPLVTGVVYATGDDTALGENAGLSRGVRKVTGCHRAERFSRSVGAIISCTSLKFC